MDTSTFYLRHGREVDIEMNLGERDTHLSGENLYTASQKARHAKLQVAGISRRGQL